MSKLGKLLKKFDAASDLVRCDGIGLVKTDQQHNVFELVKDSIAFIYPPAATSTQSEKLSWPMGTGFWVGLTEVDGINKPSGHIFKFLVTSKHVVDSFEAITLRMNTKDRQSYIWHDIDLNWSGSKQNVFTSNRPQVDLVVINIGDIENTDPAVFDYSTILDDKDIQVLGITEGTEIFTEGVFKNYYGFRKNFPMLRSGRIALLTDEPWLENRDGSSAQYGYLGELYTTKGASGSPVFTLPSEYGTQHNVGQSINYQLLGIDKGSPDVPAPVQTPVTKEQQYSAGRIKQYKTKMQDVALKANVSNGLAVIEPGKFLKEILKSIAEQLIESGIRIAGFDSVRK